MDSRLRPLFGCFRGNDIATSFNGGGFIVHVLSVSTYKVIKMQELLQFLTQVSDELNKDLNLDKMLQRVIDLTVRHLNATGGSVILFDDQRRVSDYILQRDNLAEGEAQTIVGRVLSEGFAGWVLRHGRGDIINDTADDARWLTYLNQPYQARSVMAAPILRHENVLGIITINHAAKPNFFNADDLSLLNAIAGQAVIALENARLFRQQEHEQAMLSAIITSSLDAIIVTARHSQRIIFANPAAETALNIPPGTWQNRLLAEVTPLTKLIEQIAAAAPSDNGLDLPDGRSMLTSIVEIPSVGTLTLLHDISALKTLDKMKSEFITTFTHDLSAPLAAIKGHAELIKMDGALNAQQEADLDILGKAANQMSRLITDLLDLTRLESLKDFFTCDISLEEMVENAYRTFEPLANTKKIDLQYNLSSPHTVTHGNPTLISRAIDNLVGNAIKYTPPAGTVTLSLHQQGTEATVSVRDTGIGIAADSIPMVFEKFFRAHAPGHNEIPGSGLGLSIVKTIIERHGGKIWVNSHENEGSTFTITLPVVASEG